MPNKVQDAIYSAIELAMNNGWTPAMFKSEAAECWSIRLREKERDDRKEWSKR